MYYTLDETFARRDAANKEFAEIMARPKSERAAARAKELASGTGDLTKLKQAESHFLELAIHQDLFLDDVAVQEDVGPGEPIFWKSRYPNPVGVMTGSVYGNAPATLYATTDYYATLTPFEFEAEEVKVPKLALTQDLNRLGVREAGLMRQQEAVKLAYQKFALNFMMSQPLGLDIPTTITNYFSSTPYTGRNVYVIDPGVQATTVETTNILDQSAEAGIDLAVLEAIQAQAMIMGKTVRTIHIPVAGQPWRKLLRHATVVANASVFGAGVLPNAGLKAVPESKWASILDTNLNQGKEIRFNALGQEWHLKANNVFPQGYGVVTTTEPAVVQYNILDKSVETDVVDQRDSYFVGHYVKKVIAFAQPDPWVRNFMLVKFGNTNGL